MKTLFDPVVKKIIGLITQQMAATLAESNLRTTASSPESSYFDTGTSKLT